jgi:hypothetical protein
MTDLQKVVARYREMLPMPDEPEEVKRMCVVDQRVFFALLDVAEWASDYFRHGISNTMPGTVGSVLQNFYELAKADHAWHDSHKTAPKAPSSPKPPSLTPKVAGIGCQNPDTERQADHDPPSEPRNAPDYRRKFVTPDPPSDVANDTGPCESE